MSEIVKKKKSVSYSQFSNWWICPHRWYRDYILREKVFEESLHMSFGTAIHEAIQLYLKVLYSKGDAIAAKVDTMKYFKWAFNRELTKKKIPHTPDELNEFIEDGRAILNEFLAPENRMRYFPSDKWELLGIEHELNADIRNNVNINGFIDLVMKEKMSGRIKIIDIKTSTNGWTNYKKEDFTATSQLVLYKALYSRLYNIPLSQIDVEFFILKRKLYEKSKFVQSRIQIFKPSAYQKDVLEVIKEFGRFVGECFTEEGQYRTDTKFSKMPGANKKNCKFCAYLKNGKCDGVADPVNDNLE
jgi:hypothetical protein